MRVRIGDQGLFAHPDVPIEIDETQVPCTSSTGRAASGIALSRRPAGRSATAMVIESDGRTSRGVLAASIRRRRQSAQRRSADRAGSGATVGHRRRGAPARERRSAGRVSERWHRFDDRRGRHEPVDGRARQDVHDRVRRCAGVRRDGAGPHARRRVSHRAHRVQGAAVGRPAHRSSHLAPRRAVRRFVGDSDVSRIGTDAAACHRRSDRRWGGRAVCGLPALQGGLAADRLPGVTRPLLDAALAIFRGRRTNAICWRGHDGSPVSCICR